MRAAITTSFVVWKANGSFGLIWRNPCWTERRTDAFVEQQVKESEENGQPRVVTLRKIKEYKSRCIWGVLDNLLGKCFLAVHGSKGLNGNKHGSICFNGH